MRTISSGAFRTVESLKQANIVPKNYQFVPDGTDKAPGLIGAGFGGEALVCLLPDDDGAWFEKAAQTACSEAWINKTE